MPLSIKQVAKILKAADFIIVVDADGWRHLATGVQEVDSGSDACDVSVVIDTLDDIDFKWEQKYEMQSYRRDPRGVFMRGFRINNCWVIPVKAGRA